MPNVIVLEADQADEVRGPSVSDPAHQLQPVMLTDGRAILGPEVLDDPAHAEHKDLLASCPVVDYDTVKDLLPQPEPPSV